MGCASSSAAAPKEDLELEALQTGDVLLYSMSGVGSCFNKLGSCSRWSHVSVVVRGDAERLEAQYPPDYRGACGAGLAVLEAVPRRGVSLFPLEPRLARTKRSINVLCVRRVRLASPRPAGADAKLEKFVAEVLHRQLEFNPLPSCAIVRACLFDCLRVRPSERGSWEDWEKFFCSELAAEALQQGGFLRDDFNSNDALPKSFASAAAAAAISLDGQALPGVAWAPEVSVLFRGGALAARLTEHKRRSLAAMRAAKAAAKAGASYPPIPSDTDS